MVVQIEYECHLIATTWDPLGIDLGSAALLYMFRSCNWMGQWTWQQHIFGMAGKESVGYGVASALSASFFHLTDITIAPF